MSTVNMIHMLSYKLINLNLNEPSVYVSGKSTEVQKPKPFIFLMRE